MEFNLKSNKERKHDNCYVSRNDSVTKGDGMIWNVPNSKKANARVKNQNNIELDEWFVYLVDGEKWYYKVYQDPIELALKYSQVLFLGIGRPNQPVHRPNFPTKYIADDLKKAINGNIQPYKFQKNIGLNCCYCEVDLVMISGPARSNTKTRDHIVPRHRGGTNDKKNTKWCCYECNQEKGGLMLHSYIQMLNLMLLDKTGIELIKLQTKIHNANKIAKEINGDL